MNLICYRTNEILRAATIAEAMESLVESAKAGGAGVIRVDGLDCYCDALWCEIADEIRAQAADDAETFGRECAS